MTVIATTLDDGHLRLRLTVTAEPHETDGQALGRGLVALAERCPGTHQPLRLSPIRFERDAANPRRWNSRRMLLTLICAPRPRPRQEL